MIHVALEKLCTLSGGFAGSDGKKLSRISGNHCTDKMGCRDRKPGNTVGDIAVIDIPRDAPSQAPQAGITYLWIFEGASKEEVGF